MAVLAGLSVICNPACANDAVDLTSNYIATPTLDMLHSEDPSIPKSEYSLTEFTPQDVNSLPEGTVVKYELKDVVKYYDKVNNALVTSDERVEGVEYIEVKTKESIAHYYKMDVKNPHSPIENSNGDTINVVGDFIDNTKGAIINNNSTINNVIGDFIDNNTNITYGSPIINQNGTIGEITGDFIKNNVMAGYSGAIHNYNGGEIGDISGNFIDNTSDRICHYTGGAIGNTNNSIIGDISGNFIGNTAKSDHGAGGAIYNSSNSKIGDISANFISNTSNHFGGAINNSYNSTIGDISGEFINNNAYVGGAIYNYSSENNNAKSKIGNITGNFIGNNAISTTSGFGGAIYNLNSDINNIVGNFISNSAYIYGGAIMNSGTGVSNGSNIISYTSASINSITANFIDNRANQGGAIRNSAEIKNIKGNFIANKAFGYNAIGGAIFNAGGEIGNITANFIENSVNASNTNFYIGGGAICNQQKGTIGEITGIFKRNTSTGNGGAIYNDYYSTIGEKNAQGNVVGGIINSSFIDNHASEKGGAIYYDTVNTTPSLNIIAQDGYTSVFKGNASGEGDSLTDNAIYIDANSGNNYRGQVGTLNFTMTNGGNVYVADSISGHNAEGIFLTAQNAQTFDEFATKCGFKETALDTFLFRTNVSSFEEFVANRTDCETPEEFLEKYNYGTLENFLVVAQRLKGDTPTEQFLYANAGGKTKKEFLESQGYFNYNVNIQGDDINNTTFYMLNDISHANVSIGNTTVNTINNQTHTYDFFSLTLTDDIDMAVDVDLATKEIDRFTADSYGEHKGNLNVVGMNLLSDAVEGEELTAVYFAQSGLKNHVTHDELDLPSEKYQNFEAYTPIYKYNVTYDNQNEYDDKGDGGYFLFTKGDKYVRPNGGIGSTGNPSDAFNPSVLSAPVASVSASQATVNETFKYVFEHADAFTKMPEVERTSRINANKYALSTEFNHNLGSLCPEHNNNAGWFRPYVTFETMHLNHGPKVNAITYGSLAGFDTDFHEHKHGWHSVGTGYIGYNGNQLHYSGVDTTMNGGLLGYTHTMYKGNFWSALTLSAGASVGESRTMYGKEDFTSLMAGVGTKTGYNFEFKEGKYILQPIMFMSYTFVNTFDYTNAGGVKIKPSPAHSIQLNPSVRFITNTKNGWQPYASVGMVWNVMNENKVMANSVRLPEMSMKPYVEYGLGIQRNWKDKFTAFGQAMIRNGGRNGIALTGGFRWALGKEAPKTEKVQNGTQAKDRTVLKQLSSAQKTALGAKPQNTTRTTSRAVIKSL